MSSYWNKGELKILTENFETMEWKKFEKLLPNKNTGQILRKATKLGLKKESEFIERFYDDERKAWVDKKIVFTSDSVMYVSSIFPAEMEESYENTMGRFAKRVSKVFYDVMVKNQYNELLYKTGLAHTEELYEFFWELRFSKFTGQEFPDFDQKVLEVIKNNPRVIKHEKKIEEESN